MERNEIKILEKLFDSANQGLKIVIVQGDEGSGKTDLLKYFCEKISKDAICSYFSIKELKENFFSHLTESFLKNVKKTFETGRFSIIESIGKNVNENEKFIFTVTLISSIKRTVLMFDDVENASSSLFNTLMYIAKNHTDKNLMIILAYNPLKQSENLKEFFVRSGELPEGILKRIRLEPLTLDEVVYIIASLSYHLPKYLIEKIFSSSRGNIKRIMEILNYFKVNKLIDENGYWMGTFEDIPPIESQSVKSYFYSIYRELNDDEKRLLTACSAIGEKFSLEEVKAIENMDENEIYNILDKMIMLGIIEENNEGNFTFKSKEVLDLLYNNEMSNLRKRFIHKKLAEYYEKNNADPYKIGINYYFAMEMEKAIKFLEMAALKAYEKNNYKDTIEILKKIYEISNSESHELILGECYFKIGDFKNASIYYEKALAKDRKNSLIKIAELEYNKGNLIESEKLISEIEKEELSKEQFFYVNYLKGAIDERKFNFNDAFNYYDTALKLAMELNNNNYLALIYKQIGVLHFYKGEFDKAEEMFIKSLEYYNKVSNYEGMARIYNNMALIETGRDFNKTVNYYELALSYANLSGNIYLLIIMNYNMAQINFWNSQIEEAERGIKIAKNLSEIINEFDIRHSIFSFLSDVEKIKGNFSEAINDIDSAISYAEKMGSIFLSSLYKLKKFEIFSIIGKSISYDQVDELISIMKNSNPDLYEPYAFGAKGKIYLYGGKINDSINQLLLAEKSRNFLTFVDYIDFIGDIPFSFILNKDHDNFKKYVEVFVDLSKKLNGNILYLKAYLPIFKENESFEENEKFLEDNSLRFLLLKMYICYYEIKKEEGIKNKILNLSKDLGVNLENFYKMD